MTNAEAIMHLLGHAQPNKVKIEPVGHEQFKLSWNLIIGIADAHVIVDEVSKESQGELPLPDMTGLGKKLAERAGF